MGTCGLTLADGVLSMETSLLTFINLQADETDFYAVSSLHHDNL